MPEQEEDVVLDAHIDKVSLVGNPANGESWMLFKSNDQENEKIDTSQEETEKDMEDTEQNEENEKDIKTLLKEKLDEEEFKEVKDKDDDELIDLFKNSFTEGGSVDMADQTDEEVEGSEEEGIEKSEEESSSEDESEPITKDALPEDLQDKIEKAEELEEKVQKEREKRLKKEYQETARKEYEKVSKDADEFGLMLKELDDNLPEDEAEKWKSLVKAQAKTIEKGEAFEEYGVKEKGESGQEGEFEEKAKEIRKSRDDIETIEQARAAVARENPELVRR